MSKITCVGCGMMGSNLISAFMDKGHEVTIVYRPRRTLCKKPGRRFGYQVYCFQRAR